MSNMAPQIGEEVWQKVQKYDYIIPQEFASEDDKDYDRRFNFQTYSGMTHVNADKLMDNIINKIQPGRKDNTIALVPRMKDLTPAHLDKLTKANIKFVLIDPNDALEHKTGQFKEHTYAAMELIRFADKDTLPDSLIYAGLSYYLKSHFDFTEKMAFGDYIEAIRTGKVNELIKGYVSYKVFQHYDAIPEHRTIAKPLIFA